MDGVEVTEALRFWLDRAWMDTPPGFWTTGTHVITATVKDVRGVPHTESCTFDKIGIAPTAWPVPVSPSEIGGAEVLGPRKIVRIN